MDHYRIDTQQISCGTCDNCTIPKEPTLEPTQSGTPIPVKVKHIIMAVLDTFRNLDLEETSAYINFTMLSKKATNILEKDEREVKATYDFSERSFGNVFGISWEGFNKTLNSIVEKTIVYLILEGVFEERFEEIKGHFYLHKNNVPDAKADELLEDATIYLRF